MPANRATLYGSGIFTTIGFRNKTLIQWGKHWQRLLQSADKLGIDLTEFEEAETRTAIEHKIDDTKLYDGRIRVTFCDDRSSEIWQFAKTTRITSISVIVGGLRKPSSIFKVTASPYTINSRSPLAGIKSCNYLEPIMSLDEAKGRGFHEAIRVNERGFVTSACMANVFWVKGGELFTPSLTTGCLAGTTREFVLENIDCREVEVGIEALDDAEAVFLTSAGIGVVQVAEFEARRLENVDHPILHLLPY